MNLRQITFFLTVFFLAFSASGCAPAQMLEEYFAAGDAPQTEEPEKKSRVYMDEQQGTLEDFTGSTLTLKTEENVSYTFDVSSAALECEMGMITGDEISVIYEGQLEGEDTSTVKVLKVVDEYYHKHQLKDRSVYGQILDLTCNTLTIRSRAGNTITFPITGTEQYYPDGVQKGAWIYVHYKGSFPAEDPDAPKTLDGTHIKVVSISSTDPMKIPDPTPIPRGEASQEQSEKQFQASIRNVHLQNLEILLPNSINVLSLDLSSIPCYFSGGIAPGSQVIITYQGEFNGKTSEGMQILGISGENVEKLKEKNASSTVSGVIVGKTANTVTLRTNDGATLTCYTDRAENRTDGEIEEGDSVKITFHPGESRDSNIFTGLKIEDSF